MNSFLRFVFVSFYIVIISSCNSPNNSQIEKLDKTVTQDTTNVVAVKDSVPKMTIDSIKMHAFDSLYFGTGGISKTFSINDMDYGVVSSMNTENNGVYYFMLENKSKITTERKAKRVLNDLKETISKKYKNVNVVNKTYFIKHPEERDKGESPFFKRFSFKYDEKIIGLPYEYVSCIWNLQYKEIKIGYFIDHKNSTRPFQTTPKDDYYIVYIELTSKIIKPNIESKVDTGKDSNKF